MRILTCLVLLTAAIRDFAWSQDSIGRQVPNLRFEAVVSRSPIPVGDTASILFRLRNVGPTTITLSFATTCQMRPHIARKQGGQFVVSDGLPVACGDQVTHLTIPPAGDQSMRLQVRGRAPTDAVYPQVLAPGDYVAYATLPGYALRSNSVSFNVR